jgi:hypothetical protein
MQPRTDPDRQIEQARESLLAHLGELGRRLRSARERLDVRARIASHPLASVGVAFALGALLGMRGGPARRGEGAARSHLGRAALAGLAALGMRVGKELALTGASHAARGWWERRSGAASSGSSEVRTSYDPGVEAFLEH